MITLTCIDCTASFEIDHDPLFAPRLCEPCRLARLGAAEKVLHGDKIAGVESRRRNTLEMLAAKTPSPNTAARFGLAAWTEVQAWRWRKDKAPILLIFGISGKCKTRMAAQTCIDQATEAKHAMTIDWWTGLELKAAVLSTFAREANARTLDGLRSQLARAEWLVIDDWLSHAKATASHGEFLLSVLDERIARHRPTIITMQGQPTGEKKTIIWAIEAQFDSTLTGEAVTRRVLQHSTIIQVS